MTTTCVAPSAAPIASEPLLTPEQAAALLAVTPKQLETMRGAGTGPAYSKIGYKTVRYRSEDITAYVAACRRTSTADRRA